MRTLAIVAVAVLVVLSLTGLGIAATQSTGEYPPIVQKLAKKFNLKPADVNAVFEEDRAEREKQMEARFAEMLDQAVTDGQITAKQKDLITAKRAELRTKLEAMRDLSADERIEAMTKLRSELQAWAEKNGIDMRYLMMGRNGFGHGRKGFGPGPGGFMRGPGGFGPPSSAPDASSSSAQPTALL